MTGEWQPISTAPMYGGDETPVRVLVEDEESSHEYYAFPRKRGCSGLCGPRGLPPHSPHFHDEWIICDAWGDELHPPEGYKTIMPTYWKPFMPNKPGRPKGTTQHPEKKTKNVTVKLTPTAHKWLQEKPRGWLAAWVEEQARATIKTESADN